MGLAYKTTDSVVLLGTKSSSNAITPVVLASTYGAVSKAFKVSGFSNLNLDIQYTTGAAETSNSVDLKVEVSPDGVNFYRLPNETVSAGVSTLTEREFTFVGALAATVYAISISIDIAYQYMRVSAKESGVVTNAGTVFVEATLAGK